ncbi:hypothetical protein FRC07_003916 [Ceratobasidium sp. 392]|nr:hypothetical protein FRC07_003916 [Ceratobasidium sp. 392]
MKPPETDLRTPEFPYKYFPDHWGPFPIHDIFPIEKHLRPLDVEYFYICITTQLNPHPIFVGFDDFAPVWPLDPEMDEKAIKRRDKLRDLAEFRALVRVKKMKHLTAGGIERLREAGADVSEAACREGYLVVAVTGKYKNYPLYYPDRRQKSGTIFLQYLHEFDARTTLSQQRMAERNLHLVSIDMRTFVRCMLYFERIKLRCFMINVHKESRDTVPVEERDIEWFVQKLMEKAPLAATSLRKPQVYRGARKHTSEARHVFVCHAEWLLHYAGLSHGPDRVVNNKVLERWAADAPAKREGAARDGRDGWGKWDPQWDRGDFMVNHRREASRLKYFIAQIKQNKEDKNDSGDEDKRVNNVMTHGRKVKGGNYAHAWVHMKESGDDGGGSMLDLDPDDDLSLDEDRDPSPKRRKSNSGTSLSSHRASTKALSTSSGTRVAYLRSSPSLGGSFRSSQSLGDHSSQPQAGPSRLPLRESSGGQGISRLEKKVDFIVLSSDHDDSIRNDSPPPLDIDTDSDREMHAPSDRGEGPSNLGPSNLRPPNPRPPNPGPSTPGPSSLRPSNPPSVKRESTAGTQPRLSTGPISKTSRSDDEEEIPDSEIASIARSSDSESKYKREDSPPNCTPEQRKQRKIEELNGWMIRFTPVVFYSLKMPDCWTAWHCTCPPMSMPFRAPQSLANKYECRYIIDLRNPSGNVVKLLRESTEPTDAELLKHLLAKPSPLIHPWEELPQQILRRSVELHWEEHYAAWGVKKVMVRGEDMKIRAHFEYVND